MAKSRYIRGPIQEYNDADRVRCVATTANGFVRHLARYFVPNQYHYYVMGDETLSENDSPRLLRKKAQPDYLAKLDRKIIQNYGVNANKSGRAYRKRHGKANTQYLRCGPVWVLLCTPGKHECFWDQHQYQVRNLTKSPINFGGYSITYGANEDGEVGSLVSLQRRTYQLLEASLLEVVTSLHFDRFKARFEWEIRWCLPFAPVRAQLKKLVDECNSRLKRHGFPKSQRLTYEDIPWRISTRSAFEPIGESEDAESA